MVDSDALDPADCPTANGMPMLGFGTWQHDDPEECAESVATALEMGYRHIDTAQGYDNEAAVGDGIARAAVDREEVFLATKVSTANLAYDDVLETTAASLEKLGVDAVDLLYVHWPTNTYDPEETLAAFDELYSRGMIDHVGVSNFEPAQLEDAVDRLEAPLFANQVECHPLLPQEAIRETCAEHDIAVVAYSPLGRGAVFEEPTIQEIATKHGVSEAQVSLAWLRERGVTAIPKASGEHIRDNWESLALALDETDLAQLDGIETTQRIVDPAFGPWR